jgi:hypothetical protein
LIELVELIADRHCDGQQLLDSAFAVGFGYRDLARRNRRHPTPVDQTVFGVAKPNRSTEFW